MRILILFAHPAFHKSTVNKILVEGIGDIDGVTFHDLYEQYPEFDIDVKYEQSLLKNHDCIIFQHPFFWYSTPAILKEWQDMVLEHGWAYGSKGVALKDKLFFNVISTGGPSQSYQIEGFHGYTVNQLLAPINQTAKLCGMRKLPPFLIQGTHALDKNEIIVMKSDLFQILKEITMNKFDVDFASSLNQLNDYLTNKNK